jgi:hypothetical protein
MIVVAAYFARSVLRGFDFTPELPLDAIIAAAVVFLVVVRRWAMGETPADEPRDQRTDDVHGEDAECGDRG